MPLSTLSPSNPTSTSLRPAQPAAKRFLRILYADDVRELREIARLSLSREGHGIECVEDGLIAYKRVLEDPAFDLIITDHHMPNMNGVEFVTALREVVFPGRIMVFSSDLTSGVAAEYQRLKVDRILFKPIYPSMLRQVIGELFPGASRAEAAAPTAAHIDRPLNRPRPPG
ncbi:MAG TPA: response regulator [Opitutaceae bacterium]|nr:response regulator [Opitutaceae bacterium]